MTDREPTPSDRTRLLRAAADDALTESERSELGTHLAQRPDDRAVIDFERQLRSELGRVLESDEAPVALEQRIRELAQPRPRWLRRIALLAAAALVLILGAIGIRSAIFGNVDEFGFEGRGKLVRFLGTHPQDCPITIERTLAEFHVQRFDGALSELGSLLGEAPRLGDLTKSGFEFRGMGRCGIPGQGLSMHIVMMGAPGTPLEGAMLSLYVQRDDGRLPIFDGSTYRLEPKAQDLANVQMYVWRREGLDYFLVTPIVEAALVALASAGAPPVSQTL
jgi:hypothetical protein